jgi:hypothetical protein
MARKPDKTVQLTELQRQRDELEAAIEIMIADMAEQPEASRRQGVWAENGASTLRYLELTTRLSDIEQDIVDLTRTMAAAADEDGRPH